jgi:nucleoside 2-deoxyribosyltransferase
MKNKHIYIASPLGFSEVGKYFMEREILPVFKEIGCQILDPWNLTPENLSRPVFELPFGESKRKKLEELNLIIGKNNTDALLKADALFAVLDGVDVDSGTASEIGFAAARGIPILGYRGDFRLSADNEGSKVNLQVEYFIKSSGGKIITEISELKESMFNIFENK